VGKIIADNNEKKDILIKIKDGDRVVFK